MALKNEIYSQGSFDREAGQSGGYILDLILTELSTDTAANTSRIGYKLQLRSGPSNRFDWEIAASLHFGDTLVAAATGEHYLDYESCWVLLEGQTDATHAPDGTGILSFTAAITPWNGGTQYTPPAMELTGTLALTPIPRASSITATAAMIGGVATVAVGRKDPACRHSIHYQFGSRTGYLADAAGTLSQQEVILADTAVLFPVPEDFYYEIPNAPAGVCLLTCTTYRDGAQLGQQQTCFTVIADAARCAPVLTGTATDTVSAVTDITGSDRIFVAGHSQILCEATAQGQMGATITGLWVNGQAMEDGRLMIPAEGPEITFRALDSRGYETAYTVPNLQYVPYTGLSATARAQRLNPTDGTARLTVTGTWYPELLGRSENVLSVCYRYAGLAWEPMGLVTDGSGFEASADLSGLDYRQSHTLEVTVSDVLQPLTKSVTLGRGVPIFDWGAEDFTFHVPVRFVAADGREFTLDLSGDTLTAVIL